MEDVDDCAAFEPQRIDRYLLGPPFASGGLASVHVGQLVGAAGFTRPVAIKRLHPHFARDTEVVAMLFDEARLAVRVEHPNVVRTLDVVAAEGELLIVMDLVIGDSLSALLRLASTAGTMVPPGIVGAVITGALDGLHAAHETTDERGAPLGLVHRDVSPQNILVGADGLPRVIDFGIAKAQGRLQTTRGLERKGKIAYMAPEQLSATAIRRSDLFSMGVVLWESLTLLRLFAGAREEETLTNIFEKAAPSIVPLRPDLDAETARAVDGVLARALEKDASRRFPTARAFSQALAHALPVASREAVASWVRGLAADRLEARREAVRRLEGNTPPRPRSPGDLASRIRAATVPAPEAPTETVAAPPRGRKRGRPLAAAAGAVLAIAGGAVWLGGPNVTRSVTPPPPLPPSAVSAAAPLEVPPPSREPSATVSTPEPAPSREERAKPARAKPTPRPACSPPYRMDAFGRKVYLPECF